MVELERARDGLVSNAQVSPESPMCFYNEGYLTSRESECLFRLGRPREAAASASAGLALYEKSFVDGYAVCTLHLGNAHLQSGEIDERSGWSAPRPGWLPRPVRHGWSKDCARCAPGCSRGRAFRPSRCWMTSWWRAVSRREWPGLDRGEGRAPHRLDAVAIAAPKEPDAPGYSVSAPRRPRVPSQPE
jgi:hypothetical protein